MKFKSIITITLSLFVFLGGNTAYSQNSKKKFSAKKSIYIDIPREEIWKITALDFGKIDKWISGVNSSQAQGNGEGLEGAICNERVCEPSYKGFKETTEELYIYDEENYTLAYKIPKGLPGFVTEGTNKWTHEVKDNGTWMSMEMTMEVKGLMGSVMKGMMKKKSEQILTEALEELKFYAETGEQHPRKKAAMAEYEKELAKKERKNNKG